MFTSYKVYGEEIYRIGYGSKRLGKRWINCHEKATRAEIEKQLIEDLKEFSKEVEQYVYVPLNENKKAAILSFAYHVGIGSFKDTRLLQLINSHASKADIIKEWSPYINKIWLSGGEQVVNRRRVELDTFFAGDKEIPTFTKHNCRVDFCLLNLAETWNGSPSQIRAIEYLEDKLSILDPSGATIRHFGRLWKQKPAGLASPPRK